MCYTYRNTVTYFVYIAIGNRWKNKNDRQSTDRYEATRTEWVGFTIYILMNIFKKIFWVKKEEEHKHKYKCVLIKDEFQIQQCWWLEKTSQYISVYYKCSCWRVIEQSFLNPSEYLKWWYIARKYYLDRNYRSDSRHTTSLKEFKDWKEIIHITEWDYSDDSEELNKMYRW